MVIAVVAGVDKEVKSATCELNDLRQVTDLSRLQFLRWEAIRTNRPALKIFYTNSMKS